MKVEGNGESTQYTAMLYHDNSALANIRHSSDKQQALESVAGQFEALFLQMVLRQMRSSSDVLSPEDNPFSSKEQGVYRDFYDGQLAIEMAKKQNSGIADMLVKQLSPSQAEAVVKMVEPVNEAGGSEVMRPGVKLEASSQNQQAQAAKPLNEAGPKVAYESQVALKDSDKVVRSTVAFQQPLIRKMEL
ncbi:flagellar protein [Photobacterium proteolyticum]|uniref:Flagellar protein n=1 Tax=Photobacterium proteolyticum TaxID=1903952 RepID=A0A1Q9GVD3_9GAMM|nr:rod-binding protein [Photobacterium proteolyticum]OLQ79127.1 flagellar protein [Photobacterium proteolyticum]